MLLFGSIAPGGGSGAQLWQLNGAAPADVELNTGAGALGIYAELTTNPLFKLILANLGGQDTFAAGYLDFINNIYTLVNMGNGEGGIQHSNATTGVGLSVDFAANIANPDILINASVGNNSTGQQFRSDYIKQSIVVGGIDAMFTKLTNRHFSIQNQFGNTTFQISRNGAIDTNQTVASIAPRIKTAEMPIHDISGAIVGYIDIKN
jgi:hypothetical protein